MVEEREPDFPEWAVHLFRHYKQRVAHEFLLHFNVNDLVLWRNDGRNEPLMFRNFLRRFLREWMKCDLVLFYSRSAGLTSEDLEDIEAFRRISRPEGSDAEQQVRPPAQITLEGIQNKYHPPAESQSSDPRAAFRLIDQLVRQREHRIAIVIDFIEKIAPEGVAPDPTAAFYVEMLQRWALDQGINSTGNVIIGLTTNLGMVARALWSPESGCKAFRVPQPDTRDRSDFIAHMDAARDYAEGKLALLSEELGADQADRVNTLVGWTRGFRLLDCEALNRLALVREDRTIRPDKIKEMKAELIESGSGRLLEEIDVRRGFDAIGGLDYVKEYLRRVTANIVAKRRREVPKGVLLAGPPGTGKTILAEGLAKEARMNLVRMGNIREMWVGQSERNLDRALSLLFDLAPVIVFVDEIDQAMGSRGTGPDGSGGVDQRIFARILSVMGSNEHRGEILWIAATNRPDLLDDAMLRRFDQIVPVLLPGKKERERIFRVMEMSVENVEYAGDVDPVWCAEKTAGQSGSAIETIVRKAVEYSETRKIVDGQDFKVVEQRHLRKAIENFKSNYNATTYRLQSLLSLQACNFLDMLPSGTDDLEEDLRPLVAAMREQKSNARILPEIARLRAEIASQRFM